MIVVRRHVDLSDALPASHSGPHDVALDRGPAPGDGSVRLNASEIFSRLNSSYWFVPLVVTLTGVALALSLLFLDSRFSLDPEGPLAPLRPSSAEGARALLSAVIGAMITAISVTFSVTIVALTVAAQHFGPRVLNSFVRQTSAQVVLGTFMATFAYSVLALGAIRGSGPDADVPELTVSGAVSLVVISIGALIYYVHHISTTLQIGELASAIVVDLRGAVSRMDAAEVDATADGPREVPEPPADAAIVPAGESGYMQRIDYEALVRLASARDAVVWIRREPGAFVIAGTALALVHPAGAYDDGFGRSVRHACVVGRDRTLWHDPEFAVKQLVEIALRALSPGINEPFTAITCIDRLAEGLACAAKAPPPRRAWPDASGRTRVFTRTPSFATLLHAAFDPIRIFAGANPGIYARLLESVAELGRVAVREGDRAVLRQHADAIRRVAERAIADSEDRAYVESRYHRSMQSWPAGRRRADADRATSRPRAK